MFNHYCIQFKHMIFFLRCSSPCQLFSMNLPRLSLNFASQERLDKVINLEHFRPGDFEFPESANFMRDSGGQ